MTVVFGRVRCRNGIVPAQAGQKNGAGLEKEALVANRWRLVCAVMAMGATLAVNAMAQGAKPAQPAPRAVASH